MANEVVSWELRIDGANASAQKLGNVSNGFDVLDKKTRETTTRFTGIASAGSALGTSLSRLNPQLGTLVSAFGSAGGAASGLTTAIGGIGGLLGGGLVAAVAVAIQYFANAQAESDKLADSFENQLRSVDDLIKGYREMESLAAAASRRSFGVETVEDLERRKAETEALHAAAKEALADQNRRRKEGLQYSIDSIAKLQNEIILHEKARDKIDEQINATKRFNNALDVEEELVKSTNKKLVKKEELITNIGNVELRQQQWLEAMVAERDAAEEKRLDEWYENEVLKATARADLQKEIEEEITKHKKEELRKREDAERRANDLMTASTQRYIDATSSVMASGLNALAQGRELAIGQIIAAIGSELVAAGTRDMLQAAAFFFNPYMMAYAPGLLAAGATEVGVGMSMGAAGAAATPSPSAGGGATATISPSSPPPRDLTAEGKGTSGPVVINLHTLKADEDAASAMLDSLDRLQKKRGKSASLKRFV